VKILIVLHDYLPYHKGGSEIHAHQVGRELARRGHQVTALFTERDLDRNDGEERRGNLDGVETIEVVHQREYGDLREIWHEERSARIFARLLEELRPDVVHFHHLAIWGSSALRIAKESGARVVLTLHDYFLLCKEATLLRPDGELCAEGTTGNCAACFGELPLYAGFWSEEDRRAAGEDLLGFAARERFEMHRAQLAFADTIISPSLFLARTFEAAGFLEAKACIILKAGYPGPRRPPRRRDSRRPLRVGYVGGIYFSKGLHLLVQAFGELEGVPAELHVHGHLDWFPDYVARLRRDGLGRPVHFHGPFDPDQLDSVLADLDLLVVPSVWYENMPITIQEAFRNGMPVVATDLGGMAEAVESGISGLTFPRGDVGALAEAIRSLALDPALFDRLAAGAPPVPRLEEVVDRLEAIYLPE
jgi:glycosyltransferase involved in cell wall biosynthesis